MRDSVGNERNSLHQCHRENGQGSLWFRIFGEHERRDDLQLHNEFRRQG